MDKVIKQLDSKGKQLKIIKRNKSYLVIDNQENEYSNVHFLKDNDATIKFSEKLDKILEVTEVK